MEDERKGIAAMEFCEADLELLYDTCIFYGSRLTAINQELTGCMEIAVKLESRAKEAYQMAVLIAKQMNGKE